MQPKSVRHRPTDGSSQWGVFKLNESIKNHIISLANGSKCLDDVLLQTIILSFDRKFCLLQLTSIVLAVEKVWFLDSWLRLFG